MKSMSTWESSPARMKAGLQELVVRKDANLCNSIARRGVVAIARRYDAALSPAPSLTAVGSTPDAGTIRRRVGLAHSPMSPRARFDMLTHLHEYDTLMS